MSVQEIWETFPHIDSSIASDLGLWRADVVPLAEPLQRTNVNRGVSTWQVYYFNAVNAAAFEFAIAVLLWNNVLQKTPKFPAKGWVIIVKLLLFASIRHIMWSCAGPFLDESEKWYFKFASMYSTNSAIIYYTGQIFRQGYGLVDWCHYQHPPTRISGFPFNFGFGIGTELANVSLGAKQRTSRYFPKSLPL